MTRPTTADEAWGLFNSRLFNHGKEETMRNSFNIALAELFSPPAPVDLLAGSEPVLYISEQQLDQCIGTYLPTRAKAEGNFQLPLYRQPAPTEVSAGGEFALGDRVRKTKGSSWQGRVVGFYSTELTPIGYAVESEREPGSVQIYPESALAALSASEVEG
jgi:hypothetical protein